ncbi:hypothetical protein T11_2295 [Trichinella zimbabwensis]|uniref:Uncharacterized protein n=1 Tax=Trichinella zimbabwensis TaxID=268475 RepID=A0A0V1GVF6_9BILA|nr:hypothetical protein T11_2295 [Trichinella zimbabwensis]
MYRCILRYGLLYTFLESALPTDSEPIYRRILESCLQSTSLDSDLVTDYEPIYGLHYSGASFTDAAPIYGVHYSGLIIIHVLGQSFVYSVTTRRVGSADLFPPGLLQFVRRRSVLVPSRSLGLVF